MTDINKCGLCCEEITAAEWNDIRSYDPTFLGGQYFHTHCWDRMIMYAKHRGWIK